MATRAKKAAATFDWGAYKGGGLYLSADEKAALIEGEVEFQISGVRDEPDNSFNGKPAPRFVTEVVLPNPLTGEDEDRLIGFPVGSGVDSRDNQLEGMLDYFKSGGAPLDVVLYKGGNAILIRPANEES